MTIWEATSFQQWICSVSVGDIINLFFALGTISMAVMAYRLQKSQKGFIKAQTEVMLCQHERVEEQKRQELYELKREIVNAVMKVDYQLIQSPDKLDLEPDAVVAENTHLLSSLFPESHEQLIKDIRKDFLEYHMHILNMSNQVVQQKEKEKLKLKATERISAIFDLIESVKY